MTWAAGDLVLGGNAAIWSFKEIKLGIGELDFQADDGFLEAILSFVISMPTADIWQARSRIGTMPFALAVQANLLQHTALRLVSDDACEPQMRSCRTRRGGSSSGAC